jgi:hypothetical protein
LKYRIDDDDDDDKENDIDVDDDNDDKDIYEKFSSQIGVFKIFRFKNRIYF